MAYQDIIRVAQLKSRATRFARLRSEVRAKPDEPVRVTEFFKPGIEEVSALLPPRLGGALQRWAERRNLLHRLHLPRWLDAICRAQPVDAGFARQIVLCARLLKGYSDTHRHGRGSFLAILDGIIEPALRQSRAAGAAVERARIAALADPDGAALAKSLVAPVDNDEMRRAAAE